MRVAVITPVYNSADTLPETLASMAAQTRKPDEIWLVDDASPEPATRAYLQSLGKSYEGIALHVVFQPRNSGAGAARNRALKETTCEIVAFLDADDSWLPNHLEVCVKALQESGAVFVATDFEQAAPGQPYTPVKSTEISKRQDVFSRGNPRVQYFYRGFIGILTVVAHRSALIRAGGFRADCRYSLDWEFWHAVLESNPGCFFVMISEVTARYTLSPGGLTSKTWERLRERESYLPHYVHGVAREGKIAWPLLLVRGWLTIQYETFMPLWRRRNYLRVLQLLLRAPWALGGLVFQAASRSWQRPNYLA